MKRVEKSGVDMLMQIVSNHYPNQQILHITDCSNDLHDYLIELAKERNYEYDLKYICDDEPGFSKEITYDRCRVQRLDLAAKAYNRHARLYEYAFITIGDDLLSENLEEFLKKIYRLMKNSGIVVFLLEKGGVVEKTIDKDLEDGYFVATSHIDIFKEYDVVNARKMHGWHR